MPVDFGEKHDIIDRRYEIWRAERTKTGGFRPNAGRKPKLVYESRELFYAAVDEKWNEIVSRILKFVEEGDKDMLKYILDQRIGKAPMSLSVDNKGKGMTFIKIENVQNKLTIGGEAGEDAENLTIGEENSEKEEEIVQLAPINVENKEDFTLSSHNTYCATIENEHSPPLSKGEALRAAHERVAMLQRNSGGAQEVIHTPPPPETETMS